MRVEVARPIVSLTPALCMTKPVSPPSCTSQPSRPISLACSGPHSVTLACLGTSAPHLLTYTPASRTSMISPCLLHHAWVAASLRRSQAAAGTSALSNGFSGLATDALDSFPWRQLEPGASSGRERDNPANPLTIQRIRWESSESRRQAGG